MRDLRSQKQVRCVLIKGDGARAFAAGSDINEFSSDRATIAQAAIYGKVVSEGLKAISNCALPLVAMIQGTCVGGGLAIASLCDIRICGHSSRFGVPVSNLGLVMSHDEMRGLYELVGPAVLKEILLEGRIFQAEEALQKGLINRVVDDAEVEAEAYAVARRIAAGAPLVAKWHKKFIARLGLSADLAEAEKNEAFECFGTRDYQIGLEAFLAKTAPKFIGE